VEASTNQGRLSAGSATGDLQLQQSTVRLALAKAVNITRNLRQHFQLSQLMASLGLLNQQDFYTGIRYRYLRKFYLGAGFSIPERLQVAINHYQCMARHFLPGFLHRACRTGYSLWRHRHDDAAFDITLRYPYAYNHDGDLCLTLDVNGENVCIVTFSIAPGALVGVPEPQVMLVSGIQGIAGKIAEIRLATEACNNVTPALMLLFAAQTLAAEIGIKTIVGMGQVRVRGARGNSGPGGAFDYDAFWMPLLGVEEHSDFYRIALPFTDKPIEAIAAKHRSRARKRRELRNVIRHDIEAQAQAVLLKDCLINNESY
jgi:uncharacterized protein VirK/YbjX